MSELFKSPFPTFYKSDGVTINSSGYLHFYEPGSGTTYKDIYADKTLSSARRLTNPVRLGLTGQLEANVYLNGDYKVVLEDSSGAQVDTVPNYSPPDFNSQFNAYDSSVTYNIPDYALASNNRVYRSLTNGNTGNEPSASPENWEEIYFTSVYNQYRSYEEDDIVKYLGSMYVSLQGSNTGNTPDDTASAYWRSFFEPSIVTDYTAAGFEYRNSNGYNTTEFLASTLVTADTFESIGPTGSGADHTWSVMNDIPTNAKMVIARCSLNYTRSGTTDSTLLSSVCARATGGDAAIGFSRVTTVTDYGGSASNDATVTADVEFTVPLDSSRRFDFRWEATGNTGGSGIGLLLVGYKL